MRALHRRFDCFPLAMRQGTGEIPAIGVEQDANIVRDGLRIQFARPSAFVLRRLRSI